MESINELDINPKQHIIDFHRILCSGGYSGRIGKETKIMEVYYKIVQNQIVLEPSAPGRLRSVCFHLLEELEKKGCLLSKNNNYKA